MKKWTKIWMTVAMVFTLVTVAAGCGKKEQPEEKPAIQSATELTQLSKITMVEPENMTEATYFYETTDLTVARVQYVTEAIPYIFCGSSTNDWKKISGSMENFPGEPSIRIIKCNNDKCRLQVYTSSENNKVGTWTWKDTTYVLMTEASILEEDFINECLELVKTTYLATTRS